MCLLKAGFVTNLWDFSRISWPDWDSLTVGYEIQIANSLLCHTSQWDSKMWHAICSHQFLLFRLTVSLRRTQGMSWHFYLFMLSFQPCLPCPKPPLLQSSSHIKVPVGDQHPNKAQHEVFLSSVSRPIKSKSVPHCAFLKGTQCTISKWSSYTQTIRSVKLVFKIM